MLNRAQRRAYAKKIKNNSVASICPKCGNKALFYTTQVSYPKMDNGVDINFEVKCQVCDQTVLEGEDVKRVVPPGITLPVPLEQFKKIVLYEAEHAAREEAEQKYAERNENQADAEQDQPANVKGTSQHESV